ncbi:hypothetical protein BH24DEI2_BH24DEI2_00550 [soil metagenome]
MVAEVVSEQRRILDLLAAGQLSVDEAAELLEALGSLSAPPPPPAPPAPKGIARVLRISIHSEDSTDESTLNLNVPLGLAKFAERFIPKEARAHLDRQGIDLDELLGSLDGNFPSGPLVDIQASDSTDEVTITIEVV